MWNSAGKSPDWHRGALSMDTDGLEHCMVYDHLLWYISMSKKSFIKILRMETNEPGFIDSNVWSNQNTSI